MLDTSCTQLSFNYIAEGKDYQTPMLNDKITHYTVKYMRSA